MKTWTRERLAPATASTAASTSSRRVRASAATVGPSTTARHLAHAFEVSGGGRGEPGLDHVHAETLELLRDLRLLVRLQRDAGRLLAVPQGRVEDGDPASLHVAPPVPIGRYADAPVV